MKKIILLILLFSSFVSVFAVKSLEITYALYSQGTINYHNTSLEYKELGTNVGSPLGINFDYYKYGDEKLYFGLGFGWNDLIETEDDNGDKWKSPVGGVLAGYIAGRYNFYLDGLMPYIRLRIGYGLYNENVDEDVSAASGEVTETIAFNSGASYTNGLYYSAALGLEYSGFLLEAEYAENNGTMTEGTTEESVKDARISLKFGVRIRGSMGNSDDY